MGLGHKNHTFPSDDCAMQGSGQEGRESILGDPSQEQNAQWRPAWEKATNNYLFQIIKCERNDTHDDDGNLTLSEYTATFEKSKTDAALQGQKSIILRTESGKRPTWYGLPELQNL